MFFVKDLSVKLARKIAADYADRLDTSWEKGDEDFIQNNWFLVGRTPEHAEIQVELYIDFLSPSLTTFLPDYGVPLHKHLFPNRQSLISYLLSEKCASLYAVHRRELLELHLFGKRLQHAIHKEDHDEVTALLSKYPKRHTHK